MSNDFTIRCLYVHDDFYIVNKPSGVNFHDEGELGAGFFNQCCHFYSETLYPVHRLDKLTSGLIILARNQRSAQWFQRAFENHQIDKFYVALSTSKPKKKQGAIVGDMEKSRRSQWKLKQSKVAPALTQFFSFSISTQSKSQQQSRLFVLKPLTGKTHQLRVALKSLGSPILGDELYGGRAADRGYLHAARVVFNYEGNVVDAHSVPTTGQNFIDCLELVTEKIATAFDLGWPRIKFNRQSATRNEHLTQSVNSVSKRREQ